MNQFITAFSTMFSDPMAFVLIFAGTVIGIIFGCIPGLTAGMAIALFLPLTFRMDIIPSLTLLLALYIGGISGGLISAILIKIPGTPASIATVFDGGPMADRGESWRALSVGIVFSFLGTLIGILILCCLAPVLGKFSLSLGMFEYFSVAVFSLTLVAVLCGTSLTKGLLACLIGLFMATVGAAPIDGFTRFTMGIHDLDAGFKEVPALVGLFAISELLNCGKEGQGSVKMAKINRKGFGMSGKEFFGQWWNCLRSSLIGTFIGILPGIGGSVCNLLAYGVAKKSSKYPEKFGTGIIDGIVASEASNNACIGGTMVPLLTLGIPGDAVTAILLGAFTINGLTPGPMFYQENIKLIYVIYALMFVCSIVTFVVQFFGIKGFTQLLKVPKYILLPMVMVLCIVGSFGTNNRIFDVWTLLLWGVMGFILTKFDLPLTPIIMGFILGPICEKYLRRGLMMSRGSFMPFITRPVSGIFLGLSLLMVIITFASQMVRLARTIRGRKGE